MASGRPRLLLHDQPPCAHPLGQIAIARADGYLIPRGTLHKYSLLYLLCGANQTVHSSDGLTHLAPTSWKFHSGPADRCFRGASWRAGELVKVDRGYQRPFTPVQSSVLSDDT